MALLPITFALLAGVASAATETAADQDCKQMISGTWTSKPGDGGAAASVTYQPDGVYRQDPGPDGTVETGAWLAQNAATAGDCDLTLTPKGGEERTFTLTIVDSNTVKAKDGTVSTRTEGTMEPHTSP